MVLAGLLLLVNLFQFILLPVLLLPLSPWWLLALIPCAALTNTMWFTAHESFHFNLHPDKKWNERLGRLLCVGLLVPFSVVRFGHLQHHRFNGALVDRPDLYDPAATSTIRAWVGYYAQLVGGFYLMEVASFLVFLLPPERIRRFVSKAMGGGDEGSREIAKLAAKTFSKPDTVRSTRREGAVVFALLVVSLPLYGGYWWALALALAARAFLISFANNLPHYAAPTGDTGQAYNVALPRPVNACLLNFYCHHVHHAEPRLPWTSLPVEMRRRGEDWTMPYLKAGLAQFKGPRPVSAASA